MNYDFEQALIRRLNLDPLNIVRTYDDMERLISEYQEAKNIAGEHTKKTVPFVVVTNGYFCKTPHMHVRIVSDVGDARANCPNEIVVAPRYRLPEYKNVEHIVPIDILPSRITYQRNDLVPEAISAQILGARNRAEKRGVPLIFIYIRTANVNTMEYIGSLAKHAELLVSTGPRTEFSFIDSLSKAVERKVLPLNPSQLCIFSRTSPENNPYINWLLAAHSVVITDDSMSGVSDGVLAGKPVTVMRMKNHALSNEKFLKPLIKAGAVRKWSDAFAVAKGFQSRADKIMTLEQAIPEIVRRIYAAADASSPLIS
ncbi:MAG: ELM1/GtrOC1 family putative glycosyltransferase [Alphaproteobacteria bacterium]